MTSIGCIFSSMIRPQMSLRAAFNSGHACGRADGRAAPTAHLGNARARGPPPRAARHPVRTGQRDGDTERLRSPPSFPPGQPRPPTGREPALPPGRNGRGRPPDQTRRRHISLEFPRPSAPAAGNDMARGEGMQHGGGPTVVTRRLRWLW